MSNSVTLTLIMDASIETIILIWFMKYMAATQLHSLLWHPASYWWRKTLDLVEPLAHYMSAGKPCPNKVLARPETRTYTGQQTDFKSVTNCFAAVASEAIRTNMGEKLMEKKMVLPFPLIFKVLPVLVFSFICSFLHLYSFICSFLHLYFVCSQNK